MQIRTFLRIMMDHLFINNVFAKTLFALVNFCKEQSFYRQNELKFLKKVPYNKLESKNTYQKNFIFKNNQTSGVYYK